MAPNDPQLLVFMPLGSSLPHCIRVGSCGQKHKADPTACHFLGQVLKGIVASPLLSLGLVILEEASCHVVRTGKQPHERCVWLEIKASVQTTRW